MEQNKTTALPCKVLFILGSMDIGGVQSGIMNFAKITPPEDAAFDVLVHTEQIGFHEAEFKKYGDVYHISLLNSKTKLGGLLTAPINDFVFKRKLIAFLKAHPQYGVVHSKSLGLSAAAVEAAKKCGIPVRIAQSHVDKPEQLNILSRFGYWRNARRIQRAATCKLAVTKSAADLMFGKFGGTVIKNPTISLKRLDPAKYPQTPHEGIRLIQVGTYSARKNQLFSVEIVNELIKAGEKVRMTFVGYPLDEPDYINTVTRRVKELDLEHCIRFLPKDSDIPLLLSESDIMLVPSLREGLPNVALEAQAMGVSCFLSDTITRETDCGLCVYLSLDLTAAEWAKKIAEYTKNHAEKTYVDMSMWDNEKVVKRYIKIWRNEQDG